MSTSPLSTSVRQKLLEIADDVKVPWESNCAGEIFLINDGENCGIRIGHFQGDASLAAYVVEMHNAAIAGQSGQN